MNKRYIDSRTIIPGLKVEVKNGNFEKAFKIWCKKVQSSGKLRELKEREFYLSPAQARRRKHSMAVQRQKKRQQQNTGFYQTDSEQQD